MYLESTTRHHFDKQLRTLVQVERPLCKGKLEAVPTEMLQMKGSGVSKMRISSSGHQAPWSLKHNVQQAVSRMCLSFEAQHMAWKMHVYACECVCARVRAHVHVHVLSGHKTLFADLEESLDPPGCQEHRLKTAGQKNLRCEVVKLSHPSELWQTSTGNTQHHVAWHWGAISISDPNRKCPCSIQRPALSPPCSSAG